MELAARAIGATLVAAVLLAGATAGGCVGFNGEPQSGRTVSVEEEITVGDVTWRVLDMRRTPYLDKRFTGATRARGTFLALKVGAERLSTLGVVNTKPLSIVDSRRREFLVDDKARLALDQSGLKPLNTRRIKAKTPVEGWVVFDIATDSRGLRLKALDPDGGSSDYAFIKLP